MYFVFNLVLLILGSKATSLPAAHSSAHSARCASQRLPETPGQWRVRANLPTMRPLRMGDMTGSHLRALGTVTLCDPSCTCYAKPGRRQHVWGCSFETLLSCHRLVRSGRRGQHSTRDGSTGDFWVLIQRRIRGVFFFSDRAQLGDVRQHVAAVFCSDAKRQSGETKRITVGLQMGRFFELFENVTWPRSKIHPTYNCVNNFSKEEWGVECDAVGWDRSSSTFWLMAEL